MNTPLTFLFTDLENSTQLWEQASAAMHPAMARHDALLTETITRNNGKIVKSTGDGFHAVFAAAHDAVCAALDSQRSLGNETWPEGTGPLNVRIGLHTGDSEARNGDYFGPTLNRAARVMDIAHGGQILLSSATAALTKQALPDGVSLLDKGQHRLKGIASLEQIYQLTSADLPNEFPPLRSLESYKHNLHRQLTSFVGREKELNDVKSLLAGTQLLTLLGPGGTGKTRLMLQVGEEIIHKYPDGVWFVELAPLTNPTKIPDRIAATLNVQEQPGRNILDTLFDYLRHKELLLLLDNVEHLVRDCAEVTANLLEHCPNITILVTGREALFISGETTLQIPSLSLPARNGEISFEEICLSEGVQLFMERAKAVRPDFEINPKNAPAISEIVKRLDGIPLALELAASRMRMLTVEQIADRLNDRFRLLTGGHRTALPRQQTLQALIDWSWNLLEEEEQLLLRRLSVFAGGWNINAAQAIVGFEPLDEYAVFDLLEQLINKSVVNVEYPAEGKARYNLLESIRQFARDKLFEAGEGEALRNRHAEYFAAFAQEAEPHLYRETMFPWVKKIEQELDNLRAVLTWSLDNRPELAIRICGALFYRAAYWIHFSETKSWLINSVDRARPLLGKDETIMPVEDFIKSLLSLATVYSFYSDHINASSTIDEVLQLSKTHHYPKHYIQGVIMKTVILGNGGGDYNSPEWNEKIREAQEIGIENNYDLEISQLQFIRAGLHALKGEFEEALPYYQDALAITKKIDNPHRNGQVYRIQAMMSDLKGDIAAAEQAYLDAIDVFATIGDHHYEKMTKSDLAHHYRRVGKYDQAIPLYLEVLPKWQEDVNLPALVHQLECFAFLAIYLGKPEVAARLLGKTRKSRIDLESPIRSRLEIDDLNQAMEQLAETMGSSQRDTHMLAGEGISLGDAVALALAEIKPEPMLP